MQEPFKFSFKEFLEQTNLYEHPLSQKQRDIIAAAEALFSEKGFSESPTAEIAKKAGVTERTLFKYFPSKKDLIKRVLFPQIFKIIASNQFKEVKDLFRNKKYTSFSEHFVGFSLNRWKVATQIGNKLKFVICELLQNENFRKEFGKLWLENFWHEALEKNRRYQKEGKIKADIDLEVLTRMEINLVIGFAITKEILSPKTKWDLNHEAQSMAQILERGVSK